LEKFSPTLAKRERWLLLNKIDLLPPDEVEARCQAVIDELNWTGPVYRISALNRDGTAPLIGNLMDSLEAVWEEEKTSSEARDRETEMQNQMAQEARDRIEELRLAQREARRARGEDDDDNFNEDDYDVEVIYVNH
jgi:GTPase